MRSAQMVPKSFCYIVTLVRIRGDRIEDMLRHNVLIVTHGEGDIRSDTIDQQ